MTLFDSDAARQAQETCATIAATEVVVENSIGMQLSLILPGQFTMGLTESERDQVRVHWPEATEESLEVETLAHRVRLAGDHIPPPGDLVLVTPTKIKGTRLGWLT